MLKILKIFFKKDKEAFEDMFGTLAINEEVYFKKLTNIAINNFETTGIPTLSTTQMYEIVEDLVEKEKYKDIQTPFVKLLDNFPPLLLKLIFNFKLTITILLSIF